MSGKRGHVSITRRKTFREKKELERLALENRLKRLGKKVRKWIASKEGKREIKKALKETRELSKQFTEASKVNPKILHDPMTM